MEARRKMVMPHPQGIGKSSAKPFTLKRLGFATVVESNRKRMLLAPDRLYRSFRNTPGLGRRTCDCLPEEMYSFRTLRGRNSIPEFNGFIPVGTYPSIGNVSGNG